MLIVAGYLTVDPDNRTSYLADCLAVVDQARRAPGCLDFAISADLSDESRINIFERWDSQDAVEAFRGSGISDDQADQIRTAVVAEYDVADIRQLS